ncbi:MAG: hypothetical protein H0U76_16950 [Ktedonobacteraceae bacterium]|nr:hypothetical protein [Ktedonobacteraceae bacterium]
MIPITDSTVTAVAALIYNEAYEQDPDTGWLAGDEHSSPVNSLHWLAWSASLIQSLQEQPEATDEQVLALARQCVDASNVGYGWDTIWMQQSEEGDVYSTITDETATALPLVRHFLEEPQNYTESSFIEGDSAYLAYLEAPLR